MSVPYVREVGSERERWGGGGSLLTGREKWIRREWGTGSESGGD